MKKYLVVTNIWGLKAITMWLSKDFFEEEKEYFDTIGEARDFACLFKEYASAFPNPEKKSDISYYNKKLLTENIKHAYDKFKPGERLWGYVIADTENYKVIEWGGLCMYNISRKDDSKRVKDYLFRGADEIPENYEWDEGEYDGWLQFRWGDGKNAVGYVEPEKPKNANVKKESYDDSYDENEDIENSYLEKEDKEKIKLLENRW